MSGEYVHVLPMTGVPSNFIHIVEQLPEDPPVGTYVVLVGRRLVEGNNHIYVWTGSAWSLVTGEETP